MYINLPNQIALVFLLFAVISEQSIPAPSLAASIVATYLLPASVSPDWLIILQSSEVRYKLLQWRGIVHHVVAYCDVRLIKLALHKALDPGQESIAYNSLYLKQLVVSTRLSMGSDNCNIALTYWKMPKPDK